MLWLINMRESLYRRFNAIRKSGYVRAYAVEWFLLIAGLAIFGVFIFFTLIAEYSATTEREKSQLKTQVKIVQGTITEQLTSIRNAQVNVRNEIIDGQVHQEERGMYVRKRLQGFAESISSVWLMMVLDKQGAVIEASEPWLLGRNFGEHEYFQSAKREPDLDKFYISPPFKNEINALTIAVSTMLPDLEGRFNGVIVTILDPQTIIELLGSVLYAEDARASVAYGEGLLFLLVPERKGGLGLESSVLEPIYSKHLNTGELLTVQEARFATESEQRMIALHTVNPPELYMDMGLLVGVSRDVQVLYSYRYNDAYLNVGLYATLIIISIPGLFLSQRRRNLIRLVAAKAVQDIHEKNLELEQLNQQLQDKSEYLRSLAFVDGLTQVANRRRFDRVLSAIWTRYTRDNLPLSLLMIDLDFFKQYNDFYGHQKGDECLQVIASTLRRELPRSQDLVARYGGEEFVCLLPNTDLQEAQDIARRLSDAVAQLELAHEQSTVSNMVTISIGIATLIPTLDMDKQALLQAADKALYAAKQSGRNRFCCA